MARLVPDWLRQRAQLSPERLALLAPRWTFAELDHRVDAACAVLTARGIRPADPVGLRAGNSPAFVVAVHALARLGAVLVPLNTRLTLQEVEWQRSDAELAVVLEEPQALLQAPPAQPHLRDFDLDAPHSIVYTSGTTGKPKGAVLTYGNHWWSATASALNLGVHASDSWLACLPLFHVGGLAILLRSVIYGIPVLIHERFDAAQVNHAIDTQAISTISVVSTMVERMLAQRGAQRYPESLRVVLLGGGPAPLPLLERALDAGMPIVQSYGLTETASQLATLSPEDARTKVGSAGKPLFGMQLRLGADGEILVRGPSVSPGYLHLPPHGEWFATGDLGRLDEGGYLYVLDRRDDLIVSGGENVYPAEVEAALLAYPGVQDAGVFGVPDAEWGQLVAAAVVPTAALDRDALLAFCRARIAAYKTPRRLEIVDDLPRNAGGKLLRRELRQRFTEQAHG